MKSLDQSPVARIITLCSMYIAQGIPFGFLTVTLAAYLSEQGVSKGDIGHLLAMCSLPWAFKWIWGPVIDWLSFEKLHMGRRRPWILLAQTLMMLTLIFVVLQPDLTASIKTLGYIVFIHNVFVSLQDVSTDALAVDMLSEKERGKANGMMYGCSYVGTFMGGAGLGLVTARFGLVTAMGVQIGLLALIMMVPLFIKEHAWNRRFPWDRAGEVPEPEAKKEGSASFLDLLRNLLKAFTLRSPIMAALLAVLVLICSSLLSAVFLVHMTQKLGWSQEEYSTIIGGLAVWFGLGGSLFGGFLADKVGAKRLAAIASITLGLIWLIYSFTEPMWMNKDYLKYMAFVETFLLAMLSVSLFSVFMSVSWPVVAGTQFTAYMALLNVSRTIGSWLAGVFETVPVTSLFVGAGIFQIAVVVALIFIDPGQTRRVFGEEASA